MREITKRHLKKGSKHEYDKEVDPTPTSKNPVNVNGQEILPESIIVNKSILATLKQKLPLLLILIVLIIVFIIIYFWKLKPAPIPVPSPLPKAPVKQQVQISTQSAHMATLKPEQAIAKIGAETIYKKDLDMELAYYPANAPIDKNKFLLEKMITDSVILQGASADKVITLDSKVYNSPDKDYLQRIKTVAKAKETISSQADSIEGSFVSIWFYNTKPGAAGLEEGKKIASAKITQLWNDVKSKKITIEQAGEQIKKDTSLAQTDTAYQTNAIAKFRVLKGEKITIDKSLDDALWKLKEGKVSDVILAKGHDLKTGAEVDAFYSFGQVSKIINNGKISSFDDWLSQKRRSYEIIYY